MSSSWNKVILFWLKLRKSVVFVVSTTRPDCLSLQRMNIFGQKITCVVMFKGWPIKRRVEKLTGSIDIFNLNFDLILSMLHTVQLSAWLASQIKKKKNSRLWKDSLSVFKQLCCIPAWKNERKCSLNSEFLFRKRYSCSVSDIESTWLLTELAVKKVALLTFQWIITYIQVFALGRSTYRHFCLVYVQHCRFAENINHSSKLAG